MDTNSEVYPKINLVNSRDKKVKYQWSNAQPGRAVSGSDLLRVQLI